MTATCFVAAMVNQIERARGLTTRVGLAALIETALGMANVEAIAAFGGRLEALHFGVVVRGLFHPGAQPGRMLPGDLVRHLPADILPGAALPVVRLRCDHVTTLDGAILKAPAALRTVSPASSRAIARSRISIERGCVMKTGLHTQPPW